MGLVSESSWRQCCRRTTKTEHKKLLQQAANCSFTVSLSIMGSLLMLLQISAAAGATRMSTEAQTSGEGAVAAPVMQLTHRMAGLEGSKAMRQEGTGMTMEHYNRLLEHDKRRFNNIMMQQQQMMRGRQDFEVVDFNLNGNFNADGLYYTEIQLGTPPQSFYVQMDTGRDLLWIDCSPCSGCPQTSTLEIPLSTYSQSSSSTSEQIGCSDAFCVTASNELDGGSLPCTSDCPFETLYGDGRTSSGYFVSDLLTYTEIGNSSTNSRSGATRVSFGCGDSRSGNLGSTNEAVDGLIGFGQSSISVLSQLAANGTTPNIFAHCLQGDTNASSSLVIGKITEPSIVYTSMVPNSTHYAAILLNIAVQGANISSSPILTNSTGAELQVIFDSGTTLAYLVEPFYTEFMTALNSSITLPLQSLPNGGGSTISCYEDTGSTTYTFPNLTLYFEGGTLELGPDSYLEQATDGDNNNYYCPMWQPSSGDAATDSLLGDIVLQNQIIVYDNENHQLGWKDFDCSQTISASLLPLTIPRPTPVTQPPEAPWDPLDNPNPNGSEAPPESEPPPDNTNPNGSEAPPESEPPPDNTNPNGSEAPSESEPPPDNTNPYGSEALLESDGSEGPPESDGSEDPPESEPPPDNTNPNGSEAPSESEPPPDNTNPYGSEALLESDGSEGPPESDGSEDPPESEPPPDDTNPNGSEAPPESDGSEDPNGPGDPPESEPPPDNTNPNGSEAPPESDGSEDPPESEPPPDNTNPNGSEAPSESEPPPDNTNPNGSETLRVYQPLLAFLCILGYLVTVIN